MRRITGALVVVCFIMASASVCVWQARRIRAAGSDQSFSRVRRRLLSPGLGRNDQRHIREPDIRHIIKARLTAPSRARS